MSEISIIKDVRSLCLLIVDDNPTNVLLLERMLQISGYTNIITTTDSREVVDLYKMHQPDLILLDLQMPNMDGFQVLEQLNLNKGDDYLSVIVVTAQSEHNNRLKALEMGAKDFIGKPFDYSEVLMRIWNMLEIRLLHKQVRGNNRILEDKVNERTMELQELQHELIIRLLKAAEFRDNDTGKHITRIGLYTYQIGKAMGLSETRCIQLRYASMMHDIGKIGIPDDILLKEGKLNQEEWDKMKTHTFKGSQILAGSSSEIIKMAERIALTHHERWDGSGYPNGIKGEDIPLEGRITAICDVFDALVSVRPYKPEWPMEKVIEEIERNKGIHFDPYIVEVFLKTLPELQKIRQSFYD